MREFISPFMLALNLALVGCGTVLPPQPKSFQEGLVEVGVTYSTAAREATVYAQQPRCGTPKAPSPPACADAATVVALARTSNAIRDGLKLAQSLSGTATADAQQAALAGLQAQLSEFVAITNAAKGK